MKKIILMFVLFSSFFLYSQKNVNEQNLTIPYVTDSYLTEDQSSFLSLVNSYYPDLITIKKINNYYKNNKARTLKESVYMSSEQHGYTMYNIVLQPNNRSFHYTYSLDSQPECGYIGDVYLLDNEVFKLEIYLCGKYKITTLYSNGKRLWTNAIE